MEQGRVRAEDRLGDVEADAAADLERRHQTEEVGAAPDLLIWDRRKRAKHRKVDIRVNVDLATLPGPLGFLDMLCFHVDGGLITGSDVAAWP